MTFHDSGKIRRKDEPNLEENDDFDRVCLHCGWTYGLHWEDICPDIDGNQREGEEE